MNMIAAFIFVCYLRNKPPGLMSGKEDGQGITIDKALFNRRVCVFKKGIMCS